MTFKENVHLKHTYNAVEVYEPGKLRVVIEGKARFRVVLVTKDGRLNED